MRREGKSEAAGQAEESKLDARVRKKSEAGGRAGRVEKFVKLVHRPCRGLTLDI